jgi:rhomboid family GlyGly-CTERM serine protease
MSLYRLENLICPLATSLICVAMGLLPESWQRILQFQRDAILSGELWRLLSGHLVHVSASHLLMNLAGLWLIWLLFLNREPSYTLCLFRLPTLMIGSALTLLALNPEVAWYRGLSGALHGLLALTLLRQCASQRLTGGILLLLFLVKIGWEQIAGAIPGSETWISARVIVDSHLYGAIWGGLIWLLERSHQHFKNQEVVG